jgi:4-amino-4-deoxy-L-arabinose transferase-like glycosyltransferase
LSVAERSPDRRAVLLQTAAGWVRTPAGCAAVGGLVASFFVFWGLWRPPLHAWDEAWYAKIALEMVRRGEWWITWNDGAPDPSLLRPPLCLWVIGGLYRLLGPTELATRLFSAACYVLLVAAVAAFCRRHFNTRTALTAAFLIAADRMLLFKHGARSGDTEAPLMLFLTLTIFGAWRLAYPRARRPAPLEGDQRARRPAPLEGGRRVRSRWPAARIAGQARVMLLGAAAFGAALLTKGVAALQVVPVVAAWLIVLAVREGRPSGRAAVRLTLMAVLATIPFLAWLGVRNAKQPGFAAAMVKQDLFSRVATPVDRAEPRRHSYVATFLVTTWPVLLASGLTTVVLRGRPDLDAALARPKERRPLLWLLALWWLLPMALFAVSRTHRDWYIYPSYVPAYILFAWVLAAGVSRLERRGRTVAAASAALLVLACVGGPSAWKAIHYTQSDRQRVAEMRQLLDRIDESRPAGLILYRPDPALRFYLYRAGVDYSFVWESERLQTVSAELAPAPAAHPRSPAVWVLCSLYDRDEVLRRFAGDDLPPRLVLERLGVVLYESRRQ